MTYFIIKTKQRQISRLTAILSAMLLVALMGVGGTSGAESLTTQENISVSLTLEFKSSGRCSIVANYSGLNPIYYSYISGAQVAENLPLESMVNVGWSLDLEAEQLDQQTVKITATGWLMGPFDESQKTQISMGVAGYKLSPSTVNEQVKQQLQEMLGTHNINVTDVNISSLNWDSESSKLSFSLSMTLQSSEILQFLSSELPIKLTTKGSGSGPAAIKSAEGAAQMSLDALLKATSKTWAVDFQATISGTEASGNLSVEFELRSDPYGFVTKSENIVVVNFGKLQEILPSPLSRPGDIPGFTLTLVVPPGSQIDNLPTGYSKSGNTYVWEGSKGVDALTDLANGYSGTRIEYWVGPAIVEIENLSNLSGKTVEVENAESENVTAENGQVLTTYVQSVKVENEQAVTINFEEGQAVKRIKVRFAQKARSLRIQAKQLAERPEEAAEVPSDKGLVAYYLELSAEQTPDVQAATIEFKIPQAWIGANNIDKSSVKLLRYSDGTWEELNTTKLSEDETYVYYSAESPGFSVFAATGATLPTQPFFTLPPLTVVVVAGIVLVGLIAGVVWRYTSREVK